MTSSKFSLGGRDANEGSVLKVAHAAGYQSFDTIRDSAVGIRGWYVKFHFRQGTDIMFVDERGIFFVEVKVPGEKQTAREQVFMHLCIAFGIDYYVIKTEDEMTVLLNGRRK